MTDHVVLISDTTQRPIVHCQHDGSVNIQYMGDS